MLNLKQKSQSNKFEGKEFQPKNSLHLWKDDITTMEQILDGD